jgi:hypothetical protein
MKAPNGRPTNLTERQWIQVRTPAFKKWFGDWEAAENFRWLMSAENVASLTVEEFQKSEVPLTKRVEDFYTKEYGGEVISPAVGRVILNRDGVRSSISHGLGRIKAAAFAAVPEVIMRGRVFSEIENYKDRGYTSLVLAAPIRIGQADYIGEVVINKSQYKDTNYYLHEVDIKKKLSDEPLQDTALKGDSSTPASKLIISLLKDRGKFESSKVVDENGEPLVVYHGTDAVFDVFDSEAKSKTGHPSHRLGFYFTKSKNIAEDFSRDNSDSAGFAFSKNTINRVIPAFLNIRILK